MKDDYILQMIGRKNKLLVNDYKLSIEDIRKVVNNSRIIILGGAGSIGSQVAYEIFKLKPRLLHVVDINENGLVELVRNIRSSIGYIKGEFATFAIDIGGENFSNMVKKNGGYDIWMNFAALKHVRSEKDPYTLMRLVEVNIINTYKTLIIAQNTKALKYFSVSTDKAANPINLMGASKRAMELILGQFSKLLNTSSTRFGNVAFSNGSLLDGMVNRYNNNQPLVAPIDIKRYFLTPLEAAKLSILSTFKSKSGQIFIPITKDKNLKQDFPTIMKNFLKQKGYCMHIMDSEESVRKASKDLIKNHKWPCYVFKSDTTGEKTEEIFIADHEISTKTIYNDIEVIDIKDIKTKKQIQKFIDEIIRLQNSSDISIKKIKIVIEEFVGNFNHQETGKYLESKM
jgi:FlaA1/EpsC-like NDP-sugar epimerase